MYYTNFHPSRPLELSHGHLIIRIERYVQKYEVWYLRLKNVDVFKAFVLCYSFFPHWRFGIALKLVDFAFTERRLI